MIARPCGDLLVGHDLRFPSEARSKLGRCAGSLEHFPAKWTPVCVAKMRQIKTPEHFPDSIKSGKCSSLCRTINGLAKGL